MLERYQVEELFFCAWDFYIIECVEFNLKFWSSFCEHFAFFGGIFKVFFLGFWDFWWIEHFWHLRYGLLSIIKFLHLLCDDNRLCTIGYNTLLEETLLRTEKRRMNKVKNGKSGTRKMIRNGATAHTTNRNAFYNVCIKFTCHTIG